MKFSRTTVLGAASLLAAVSGTSLRAEGVSKEEPPMWANVGGDLTCSSDYYMGAQRKDGKIVSFAFSGTQSSLDAMDEAALKVRAQCAEVLEVIERWADQHQTYAAYNDQIPWFRRTRPWSEATIEISDRPEDEGLRHSLNGITARQPHRGPAPVTSAGRLVTSEY